jgi:anti-sigma B factor antagonist
MGVPVAPLGAGRVAAAGTVPARGTCVLNPRRRRVTPGSTTTAFVAATEWLDDGTPVVSVMGELDLATAPALEEALLAVPDELAGRVIVDLARCSFMDLRGLHVLLAARERLERSSRPLALVVRDPTLLRVFKITRVDGLFAIYPSLTAAAAGHGDG